MEQRKKKTKRGTAMRAMMPITKPRAEKSTERGAAGNGGGFVFWTMGGLPIVGGLSRRQKKKETKKGVLVFFGATIMFS